MTTHLHETLRGGQAWSRRLARHQQTIDRRDPR